MVHVLNFITETASQTPDGCVLCAVLSEHSLIAKKNTIRKRKIILQKNISNTYSPKAKLAAIPNNSALALRSLGTCFFPCTLLNFFDAKEPLFRVLPTPTPSARLIEIFAEIQGMPY